ncbi:hypothetical protein P4S63_12120 [Pseudoalteromonas sp. B193]
MTSIASNQPLQVIQLSDGENLAAEILPFGAIIKALNLKNKK